jgi:hypothetical protein
MGQPLHVQGRVGAEPDHRDVARPPPPRPPDQQRVAVPEGRHHRRPVHDDRKKPLWTRLEFVAGDLARQIETLPMLE